MRLYDRKKIAKAYTIKYALSNHNFFQKAKQITAYNYAHAVVRTRNKK